MALRTTTFPPYSHSYEFFNIFQNRDANASSIISGGNNCDVGGVGSVVVGGGQSKVSGGSGVAAFRSYNFAKWRSNIKISDISSGGAGCDSTTTTTTTTSRRTSRTSRRCTSPDCNCCCRALESSSRSCLNGDMTMLQLLAFNALDLTAPASDILLKSRRTSWVQLSGHPGSFAPAGPGTLWKKQGSDNNERVVYESLMKDPAAGIVPKFHREVTYQGESFIEMQDLLYGFTDPNVMDIKMGTRTFLESEVTNNTARPDLYEKMVKVDPSAPTKEEHEMKAVTKLRYMMFREQQSSTCILGFRIEAIKFQGKPPVTDLKMVQTLEAVQSTLQVFLNRYPCVQKDLLARLKYIREQFTVSPYFQTHEVIGSSILIVYDSTHVGAWMIDFVKTLPLPDGVQVTHQLPWQQGNHEEGYLTGISNLIQIIEGLNNEVPGAEKVCNR